RHPVLQQIADTRHIRAHQLRRVPLLHVLRQHQHLHARPAPPDLQGRAQPLVGVGRRHPHVHHHRVRRVRGHGRHQRLAVAHRRRDLVPLLQQQPHQPLAQQRRVLRQDHPHGSSALTTVGPPGGLSTSKAPSSAATRRRSPDSPPPDALPPPAPSSRTRTTSVRPSRRTATSIRPAPACLLALVTASLTTKYAAASTAAGGRSSRSQASVTGTADLSATPASASPSPSASSPLGYTRQATSRSSASACCASVCAWPISSGWPRRARPISIDSATSRCCSPSCRSRSMRRRSESTAATMPARLSDSSAIRRSKASVRSG